MICSGADTYFFISLEHDTDQGRWDVSGRTITCKEPGVHMELLFEQPVHASQWFQAMMRFAKGGELVPRAKALFRDAVEYPTAPVRWIFMGSGWRRILGGVVQRARWQEIHRGSVVRLFSVPLNSRTSFQSSHQRTTGEP